MKTEYREVTVKQEVYIAEDGREFRDIEECKEHELHLLENSINMYDAEYKKTDFDSCIYAHLITEDDVERFKKLCTHQYYRMSTSGIDKPGIYMLDNCSITNNSWVNLDEVIFNIRGGEVEK